ncbi:glycoside hydrolase family 2 protein [Amphibacillus cookii]|uniref:glycoside hydrolase family 2 protein n=1 Tax=Amphibacillus cookii TaxID=767787 RepID=UPI00195E9908|nr:glycoside hydrolase family 2 TIM barrel-domain containing protein [Amphibacillus cookii]MBM7541092.1 beta-galactosidase [Amphibacillus cookii]
MINVKELNQDWLFTEAYESSADHKETRVDLPHCFNAKDGQSGEGMFKGKCRYQRKITLNQISNYYFLEVGAASLVAEVYVNDHYVCLNRCGFSMFRVHLTPYLVKGENTITIFVDNAKHDDVYPLMADFSFYGGLYRDVKLIEVDHVHFDLMDNGKDGIYVAQKALNGDAFELSITGTIINERHASDDVVIAIELFDRENNCTLKREKLDQCKDELSFKFTEQIESPHLWQGVKDPYLYQLQVSLYTDGNLIDKRQLSIGFRTIEVTADQGILLNGEPLKLNGVSRHQDFSQIGNALTKEHMERDLALIKEVGANSVRLAHYQHHDYFYTLCDEAGLLVWAEIPFISVPTTTDEENQNAKEQLERLIKQAYNHTSIYCWGVQNEITIAVENERIYELVEELVDLARHLDSTRIIAQANIHSVNNKSYLNGLTDIVGYNLYYGWYYGEMGGLGERLDAFNKDRPNIPVLVSEYGVDTNPKFHSYHPEVKDYTEEYQLLFQDNALRTFEERPYVLGGYVWAMFDFGSEIRNEGGAKGINQKGLVTIDRQTKKDAFYLCKAYWSGDPFVKLAGSRFVNRHRKNNDIVILSNLSRVELLVNGSKVAEQAVTKPMETIKDIALTLGENVILVNGYDQDGNQYQDDMRIHHVKEQDKGYTFVQAEEKSNVTNWFEKFDLKEVQEVNVKEGYYSIFDTIEDLYKNQKAKAVFKKYFGDIMENDTMRLMTGLMTIESMSKRSRFKIPKELLGVINSELNVIPLNDDSN